VQNRKFVYLNPIFQKLSGYSYADLADTNPLDYIHPDDRKTVRKKAIQILKGKSSKAYEYRFTRKNGWIIWVLEMVTSVTYKGERAALASFMDITERKKMEETIHHSEEKYRTILDEMEEGYFENDLAGNLTFVNDAFCRCLGYTSEEMLGINFQDQVAKDDVEAVYNVYNKIYKTGNPQKDICYRLICKDGTTVFVELSAFPRKNQKGEIIGFWGVGRDITRRRQMEEALRQSEERYRTILDEMEDGYFEVDLAGNFTFVNDADCRLLGYSREELIGTNFRGQMTKEESDILYNAFGRIYSTGKPERGIFYQAIRKDGTTGFAEVTGFPLRNQKGEIIGFRGIARDITQRRQMEEVLRQSEERYRTILDEMEDAYYEVDIVGNYTFVNDAVCRHLGYPREELIGASFREAITKEDIEALYKAFSRIYSTGKPERDIFYKVLRKDGTIGFAENTGFPLRNQKGEIIGFRGVGRDITQRKQMEEALRQSEERYRTIIKEMEEWYFETDLAGNITFFNDIFAEVLGYSQKELTGLNFQSFVKKEEADSVYRLFHQVFKTGKPTRNFPYEFIQTDGTVISAEFSIFPKRDKDGIVYGFRGVGHDITERKQAEKKIQYQATHDALTGLPNRLMFSQLLNQAIKSAHRYKRQFAVLFMDLDRFKIINDTMGHDAGDELLQEIAARLKNTLRAVDVTARLGGDEFVILIDEVSDINNVATVAHKILNSIIKPLIIMGQECRVTASIGISIYPKDAEDEQSLMKNADMAMYLAKEGGKNNYQFYSEDIQSKSLERLSIEKNLRFALERNELFLHYQAKLDFKTDVITGVEALLRWQNPYLGSVTPTQFIPVAEETGLIVSIGKWVMRTACKQNVAWQQEGLPSVCMAVNLSLRQLTDENLIDDIRGALNDSGMEPNLLELEITESMVMHNPARMISILAKIKSMGVRLAIDDFGTGYSSLAQIKHFPIDTLKVDRSFIRNIPQDAEDKAITEAIIAMGKTLSLTVVAEGVETQEQLNFLREHSCDEMQGYHLSKPIAPEQFADLLKKHIPSPQK
jgi:diguanylate cyclase (GGDEF)-like protein/PAS domain S-box-containing protein